MTTKLVAHPSKTSELTVMSNVTSINVIGHQVSILEVQAEQLLYLIIFNHKNFKNFIKFMIKSLERFLLVFAILLLLFVWNPSLVIATIQQQQEAPGQLLYSSRHKLRDSQGNTWQVILFKRVKHNQTQDLDLRLVGFPQQFEFNHPGNLSIVVNGQVYSARDRFVEKSPSPNVGEFEIQDIIPSLPRDRSGNLILPLTAEKPVEILLPAPVILEWQELSKSEKH